MKTILWKDIPQTKEQFEKITKILLKAYSSEIEKDTVNISICFPSIKSVNKCISSINKPLKNIIIFVETLGNNNRELTNDELEEVDMLAKENICYYVSNLDEAIVVLDFIISNFRLYSDDSNNDYEEDENFFKAPF